MFSVNQLRLGTITATDYCLGSIPVQKMYMGSVLVFDRTPAEEVRYFFEVSPKSDIEFDALDSEKTLTVTSYSQVYSGDSPSGSVTPVTPSIQNPEFITNNIVNNEDGTFTITLKANDYYQDEDGFLSKRNDTITISQSQSGDNTTINISQSPIVPTVQNRWLRLKYAAEEDQYITVNKANVELPYVSDWKNYVFPKKSAGIKPIRWNAKITNQDFMHEVLAYMSEQTIVYVDEDENAQENKSQYTAADSMCIATSNRKGLYFQGLLKDSGIQNGEVTFKIDGNGYWGQFYECFSGCRFNKVTIQFMQDNIHISSMNRAFRAATIKELNILDSNGESSITKHFTARDLSGMCEKTSGITNFPDIIDWESLNNNFSTGLGWAFSYAIPLISIAQHGNDREASSNTIRCGVVIQAFQKCSNLQSIGPVLDVSRVPGQSSDNGKTFEGCTALTDIRIRNLNGPTWHFDDDIQSGNIPNLDQASVTYLFDHLMDLTKYNAEDTSGAKPKSDHGDLYCPAEWQDKITSEMIIAAAAKNWNIYIGGELQTVGDTKYTFTVPQPTISLPAQAESGNFTLSWESYKQDVVNGEVQETKTKVGVTTNSLEVPEWIQLSSQEEGELGNSLTFNFSNNTTADERSFTFNLTQQESSKKLTVVVTQSGAEIETTYTWNVTPTTVTIDGTNTATINVTSYKQQWIGDIQQGSQTPVDFQYTNPGLEETIKATKTDNGNGSWTITLSGGQPSVETTYQMVFTADEGDNSTTVTVNKVVAGRNYGDITITEFTYPDIAPASGSTLTPILSYTQSWGYGDSTTDGGTITSGATLQFAGGAVNASNGQYTYASKGKELSEQTDTQVTVTVSLNGKTKTATANASQAANAITNTQYTEWTITQSNIDSVSAEGQVLTINPSIKRTKTDTYSSKATKQTEETSTDFTLQSNQSWAVVDNKNINVQQNTGDERSATITITSNGKSTTFTITQSTGQTITSYGNITINGGSATDIPASGGTVKASGCTATIQVTYSSGSTGSVTVPAKNITYTEVSAGSLGTTAKARTKVGTSTCTVSYQGKTATKDFDVYQQANTRSTDDIDYGTWQVNVSANPTTIAAGGGTSTITRSASRTRVQNYSYTSGATSQSSLSNETGTPTLSIAGSGFSLNSTTVTASSNVPAKTYTLSVTNPSAELEDGPAHNLSSTVTSTYSIAGTNSRNCTVTANMNGIVKTCTITQSGNTASSGNQDWSVAKGTGLNSATKSSSTVVMTPEPQYGNKNETFTGQCTVTQTGSNKTATATGTWYKGYLNVSPTSLQFDANGGTKTVEIDTNLYWEIVPA